jgi:hypothetical protein
VPANPGSKTRHESVVVVIVTFVICAVVPWSSGSRRIDRTEQVHPRFLESLRDPEGSVDTYYVPRPSLRKPISMRYGTTICLDRMVIHEKEKKSTPPNASEFPHRFEVYICRNIPCTAQRASDSRITASQLLVYSERTCLLRSIWGQNVNNIASTPFVSPVRLAENRAVVSWSLGLFTALTRTQRRATFYTARPKRAYLYR